MSVLDPLSAAATRSALTGAGGISGAANAFAPQPPPAAASSQPAPASAPPPHGSPLANVAHIATLANLGRNVGKLAGTVAGDAAEVAPEAALAMHAGGVVPDTSGPAGLGHDSVLAVLTPGERVTAAPPVHGRRLPPGYAPGREKVTNDFGTKAVGGDMSGIVADLSWPRAQQPGVTLVPRGGPVCETCQLPAQDHVTPAAQAGYQPLASVPGVHPSIDDGRAHSAADDLYTDPRRGEFSKGQGR